MSSVHNMNLLKLPFCEIRAGRKNVEMRLYDEKRRKIKVGDRISFSCDDFPGEKLLAAVENIYIYEDFAALAEEFSAEELGFAGKSKAYIADFMTGIYGEEKIKLHKAAAIKIALAE